MITQKDTSFQTILETRTPKKNNTFPVKLRVTHCRIQRYYNLGIDLTLEEFNKVISPKPKEPYQSIKLKISAFEQKAQKIINNLSPFTFDEFKEQFVGKTSSPKDVYDSIQAYINRLTQENRHGSAESYKCTLNSLKKFKPLLSFKDITPKFLEKYEAYMLSKNASITTVGIYLRSLRAIINQAIEKKIITNEQYPFGKNKYVIPSGRNIKKALTLEEISKIFHYETIENTMEDKAKSFWILSYLLNGINMKDLCMLQYKNLSKDKITFIRAKTQRTKKSDTKQIVAMLSDEANQIIAKYSTKPQTSENYLFDIVNHNQSPLEQRKKVHQFVKNVNKYMKRIATELEIDKPLTTYVARHSFSTVLKRSGAPIEYISEALGHSNIMTTESYLDSFEDSTRNEFTKALLAFKKD